MKFDLFKHFLKFENTQDKNNEKLMEMMTFQWIKKNLFYLVFPMMVHHIFFKSSLIIKNQ